MERKCPKCSGEMEIGFLQDRGVTNVMRVPKFLPVAWIAGVPEFDWAGNVKYKDRPSIPTETWRCTGCGYLESYASAGAGQ